MLIVHIYEPTTLEYNFWGQPLTCKILEQNIRVKPEALWAINVNPSNFGRLKCLTNFLTINPIGRKLLTVLRWHIRSLLYVARFRASSRNHNKYIFHHVRTVLEAVYNTCALLHLQNRAAVRTFGRCTYVC